MGSGIAESVARAGLPVIVRDLDRAAVGAARDRIDASLAHAEERGKVDASRAERIRGAIQLTTELEEIAPADLVIEAVPKTR